MNAMRCFKFAGKAGSALLAAFLSGCAATVVSGSNPAGVQVLKEANALAASCKRLAPVAATVEQMAPAQSVYDAALSEARRYAKEQGADSLLLLGSDHSPGLRNRITVNGVALKCY